MNLYSLSDEEFIDCMGPDWAAMTDVERLTYPFRDALAVVGVPLLPPVGTAKAEAAKTRLADALLVMA